MNIGTPANRKMILTRAEYRCEECGATAPKDDPVWCGLDIHHRVPVDDGGSNELENLLVLCEECHYRQESHSKPCPICEKPISRNSWGAHVSCCLRGQIGDESTKPEGAMKGRQIRMPDALWERLERVVEPRLRAEYIRKAIEAALDRDELAARVTELERKMEER